jgi:hypothetical protein
MCAWISLLTIVAFALPNTQQILAVYRPGLGKPERTKRFLTWRPSPATAVLAAALFAAAFLSLDRVSEFLYYQF